MPAIRRGRKPGEYKGEGASTIKSVTLKLFTKQGYKDTTIRNICDAVGITAPSFYYYFASKEKIYTLLIEEATQSLAETLKEAMGTCEDKTMEGKLFRLYKAIMDLYQEQPDQMILLLRDRYFPEREISHEEIVPMTSWLSPLEEEVVTFLENSDKKQRFSESLEEVLTAFDRLITGLILQLYRDQGEVDLEKAWALFVKRL